MRRGARAAAAADDTLLPACRQSAARHPTRLLYERASPPPLARRYVPLVTLRVGGRRRSDRFFLAILSPEINADSSEAGGAR